MRRAPLLSYVALVPALAMASRATAAWPPDGLELARAVPAASIQGRAIGSDGGGGVYAAWFEADGSGVWGLRLHHRTRSGELSPGWSADGVRVGPVGFPDSRLQLVPDGTGGTFAVWAEDSTPYQAPLRVFVLRLGPDGSLSPGWPARGVPVAPTFGQNEAVACEDGAGGVLVSWSRSTSGLAPVVVTQRMQADGTRPAGWPAAGRPVAIAFPGLLGTFQPRLVRDPALGFWLSFVTVGADSVWAPSAYAVAHLTTAGWLDPGQPPGGLPLSLPAAEVPRAVFGSTHAPIALAPDGAGGVFAFTLGTNGNVRAFRVRASLDEDPAWPVGGRVLGGGGYWPSAFFPDDTLWPVAAGDLAGTGYVGWAESASTLEHGIAIRTDGTIVPGWGSAPLVGGFMDGELAADATGAYFASLEVAGCAHFNCGGPLRLARLDVAGTIPQGWPGPSGANGLPGFTPAAAGTYGTIRLASDGSGGVFACWLRDTARVLQHYTVAGALAAVESPDAPVERMRARFDPAIGIRVTFAKPLAASTRVELFDVAGRRVMRERVAAGATACTLSATRTLAAGLYAARCAAPGIAATARVIVTR